MAHWLIKAAIQGMLSILPGRHALNHLFQRYVTRGVVLNAAHFETKLAICHRHIENYLTHGAARGAPFTVVELGTGWHPIVPVGMFLCGASPIYSLDINPLIRVEHVIEVLQFVKHYADDGRLAYSLPHIQSERLAMLLEVAANSTRLSVGDLLHSLDIDLLVLDARHTGFDSGSIDLCVSNNTLEHVPGDVIRDISVEFRRILRPGGIVSHLIDLSDHYSHFDGSITAFNYMRFSPAMWRLFNNPLQYQNRLRASEYRELHTQAGLTIVEEEVLKGSPDDLVRVPLHPTFKAHSQDDLLGVNMWLVATPTP